MSDFLAIFQTRKKPADFDPAIGFDVQNRMLCLRANGRRRLMTSHSCHQIFYLCRLAALTV